MASYVLTTNWETFSDAVRGAIKNAYDAAAAKGASFSDQTTEKTLANLASFINTIVTGAVTHVSKTVSPGAPGTQPVTYLPASDDVDYYDSVTVNPIPSNYLIPSGNLNISDGSVTARDVSDKATVTLVPGDLESSNIRSGATILGVQGSDTVVDTKLEEGETAVTAAYMLSGRTAYINGNKITGTMVNRGAITTTLTATTPSVSKSTGIYTSGTISVDLTTFGSDISDHFAKEAHGNKTFSAEVSSVTAYSSSAQYINLANIGFIPKIVIMAPYDYNAGVKAGTKRSSGNRCTGSVTIIVDGEDAGPLFGTIITSNGVASLSYNNVGWHYHSANQRLYFQSNTTAYIAASTWTWRAYA